MTYDQLICFLAVTKSMNITEAASTLFMSPSTASRQIARLEEELQVRLFDRQPGELVLTEAGRVFLDYAREAEKRHNNMRLEILKTRMEETHHLRMRCLGMSYPKLIMQTAYTLRNQFPQAEIEMVRTFDPAVIEELRQGKLDILLCVCGAIQSQEDLVCVPLKNGEMVVVLSREHRLTEKAALCGGDLQEETVYMWDRARNPLAFDLVMDALTVGGKRPDVIVRPYNRDDVLWPVVSGQGVSIFSSGVVTDLPDTLVKIPFASAEDYDARVGLFYRRDNTNSLIPYACDMFVRSFREV